MNDEEHVRERKREIERKREKTLGRERVIEREKVRERLTSEKQACGRAVRGKEGEKLWCV